MSRGLCNQCDSSDLEIAILENGEKAILCKKCLHTEVIVE